MRNSFIKIVMILVLLAISALLNSCYEESIEEKAKEQDPACKMLPKPGRCKGRIESYFFNHESGQCMPFMWGGCGGSRPFETLQECQKKCK